MRCAVCAVACVQVASQYVMSPPIRNKEHQRQLKQGLAGGILEVRACNLACLPLRRTC